MWNLRYLLANCADAMIPERKVLSADCFFASRSCNKGTHKRVVRGQKENEERLLGVPVFSRLPLVLFRKGRGRTKSLTVLKYPA
jgi:hypothetical protein